MLKRIFLNAALAAAAATTLSQPVHGQDPEPNAAAERAIEQGEYDRAERLLDARLTEDASDLEARFLRARVRSWTSQWQPALADYDMLLDTAPQNADYILGRAQVLYWSEDYAAAAAAARRGRQLAPDYEALYRLELQALGAMSSDAARGEASALLSVARERFPEAEFSMPEPASESRFVVTAGASHDSLDGEFRDWQSSYVRVDVDTGQGYALRGGVRSTNRFGLRDHELSAGFQVQVDERWGLSADLSLGPNAQVLPESAVTVAVNRDLGGGWIVRGAMRYADYASTYSNVVTLNVDRYWGDYRLSYSLHRGEAQAADVTLSQVIRADRSYGSGSSIGVLLASGEESESLGLGQLLTTDVSSLAFLGEHRIDEHWGLRWAVSHTKQGDLYKRSGLDIGVQYRH
jgi:YaiO family outer membrane protein